MEDENPIQVEEQHPDGIAMKKLSTFKFKCSSTEAELMFYAYNYNKKLFIAMYGVTRIIVALKIMVQEIIRLKKNIKIKKLSFPFM